LVKPRLDKLGYKTGYLAGIYQCPINFADLLALPALIDLAIPPQPSLDFLLLFVKTQQEILHVSQNLAHWYQPKRALWFAYPKKSGPKKSGQIATDLSRDIGWQPLLALDLLPVTIIALDADWSALRFRYRSEIKTLTRKSALPGEY
jgi:hypothetical protein